MEDEAGLYGMEASAGVNHDVETDNEELRSALLQKVRGISRQARVNPTNHPVPLVAKRVRTKTKSVRQGNSEKTLCQNGVLRKAVSSVKRDVSRLSGAKSGF